MKQLRFDVLSFAAGVVFVVLAVALLAAGSDVVRQSHWVWPLVLVGLGAAGLASALRRDEPED